MGPRPLRPGYHEQREKATTIVTANPPRPTMTPPPAATRSVTRVRRGSQDIGILCHENAPSATDDKRKPTTPTTIPPPIPDPTQWDSAGLSRTPRRRVVDVGPMASSPAVLFGAALSIVFARDGFVSLFGWLTVFVSQYYHGSLGEGAVLGPRRFELGIPCRIYQAIKVRVFGHIGPLLEGTHEMLPMPGH